jgi:DNA-binding CsgD family transcriptional regulator
VVESLRRLGHRLGGEVRLAWVVRAKQATVTRARVAFEVSWRLGGLELVEPGQPEMTWMSGLPPLAAPSKSQRSPHRPNQGFPRWLTVREHVLGAVDCTTSQPPPPNELRALTLALAESWDRSPALRGTVVVERDGKVESATLEAQLSLQALGLGSTLPIPEGRPFVEVGPATLQCEPLLGPTPRILVRLEPAERLVVPNGLPLSTRQHEVADLAARGLRIVDIAMALGCAETTVKTHLRAAYSLLGVSSRVELLRALAEHDDLSPG